MSSTRMMRQVLEGFEIESKRALARWSDAQLDAGLLDLRSGLEKVHPGQELSFYRSPLVERWRPSETEEDEGDETATASDVSVAAEPSSGAGLASPPLTQGPINRILYGPPGTGKTHWLQQKQCEYTDVPSAVDRESWRQELLANHGWRQGTGPEVGKTHKCRQVS